MRHRSLTSSEPPGPDGPGLRVTRVYHERNRTWCLIGTFVICVMVLVFLFILALMERTAEAFATGTTGVLVLTTWQMLVRYYFPASTAPSPPDDGRPKLTVAGDDPAVA